MYSLTGVMHPDQEAYFHYELAHVILMPGVLVRGAAIVQTGPGCEFRGVRQKRR